MFVFLDADLAADADEDPYEERTYATDCRVMTPEQPFLFQNVKNTVLDEFFCGARARVVRQSVSHSRLAFVVGVFDFVRGDGGDVYALVKEL